MACLLGQSHEVLQLILTYTDAADLGRLARTCQSLNDFIKDNTLLWKEMYLQSWDTPSQAKQYKWQESVMSLTRLEKLFDCESYDPKRDHLELASTVLLPLLESPEQESNAAWLSQHFSKQSNIDCFLTASTLFKSAGPKPQQQAASTPELRQLSARLHCLHGVPIDSEFDGPYKHSQTSAGLPPTTNSPYHIIYPAHTRAEPSRFTRSKSSNSIPSNNVARAKVYDLRDYTDASLWGPFKNDGSQYVDWEKMEAIMVVLSYNMRVFAERSTGFEPPWQTPWDGLAPNSFISPPAELKDEALVDSPLDEPAEPTATEVLAKQDPYGITGTWMRVVCFLDYNDLYGFNFAQIVPNNEPRKPIDTKEAIRLIKLKLHVTKIEPPGEDDGQDLPVVHFRGTSKSLHSNWDPNANSGIRGVVRQTPEGFVRWTTWSIFHGEERWRSEGIQVGGLKSKRGVLGNWFDKDYDPHGPAGPTAFWKESDHIASDNEEEIPARGHPFLWEWRAESDTETDGEDEADDDDEAEAEADEQIETAGAIDLDNGANHENGLAEVHSGSIFTAVDAHRNVVGQVQLVFDTPTETDDQIGGVQVEVANGYADSPLVRDILSRIEVHNVEVEEEVLSEVEEEVD